MIELQNLYRRIDVISPQFRLSIALARLIRKAVTPHIHCDKSVVLGQVRVHLPTPREPTLRKAMDKHDGAPAWVARLDKVELCATTACDLVVFHHLPPFHPASIAKLRLFSLY